jgi:hypothetical protein
MTVLSPSEDIRDESERRWEGYFAKSLVALTFFSGILLAFYIFITYRVLFHSDSAMFNLLADEIIRTRQFFPSDWYYVNDIWILTPHLVIVPLALLFHQPFMLHATACFVFAILFAGALYLLCDASGLKRTDFLFAISLLFTGLSPLFAENLFGQFAYGGSVASTFVVLALVFSTLQAYNERDRSSLRLRSCLLVIFLSTVMASGVRGLLLDVLPSIATLAIVTLILPREGPQPVFRLRAVLYVGLLIIAAAVLGMMCFIAIRAGVHFQNYASGAHYVDYEQLKSNIGIFAEGFLKFTGAMPTPNKDLISVYGFITAYRLFWFGLALLLPFGLLFWYRRITNPNFQFLIVYYVFSFVVTSYVYVFSSLAENVFTFRYLISPCILAIILIVYAIKELRVRYGAAWACLALAACLPIYASSYSQMIAPYFKANVRPMIGTKHRIGSFLHHENPQQPLADYLVSQNLRYGYATYWNAGVLTILSSGKTRVNAIQLTAPILPSRWLVSAHAYAASTFRDRTFLLLTDQEYSTINGASLGAYLGPPESIRSLPGYRIMVYGFNIAAKLPNWELPDWENSNVKLPVCQGTFDFTNAVAVPAAALRGFSGTEPFGRWTDGSEASFACTLPPRNALAPSTVRIATSGFVFAGHTQRALVSVNGSQAVEEDYAPDQTTKMIEVPLPNSPGDKLLVTFSLPDAVTPKELGLNSDRRKIAISVRSIEFK